MDNLEMLKGLFKSHELLSSKFKYPITLKDTLQCPDILSDYKKECKRLIELTEQIENVMKELELI